MSAIARNQVFSAVHTVGGLLPADMLVRISEGKDVSGCRPADYRIAGSRSVRDEAERHWAYLRSLWTELRETLPAAPDDDLPSDPTRSASTHWLAPLFDTLGFGVLTAIGASGITSDDGSKTFPISHRWNHVPVHLTAWNSDLDKRPGGAGTVPPQSLVQECLNRTDAHLWGVVTNGRHLRLLRDSSALATASYVEFDLESIFDGELFSEFVLLYRLLHVSRFATAEGAAPSTCWLEKWRVEAIASGTRALDQLRDGVQKAITILGTGFLRHPDNTALRANVDVAALHQALLRLVYRLLFAFVAEDRGALHHPDSDAQARTRYATYFSTTKLRAHARRRRGTAHHDLYESLQVVLKALGDVNGRPELGLPGLGGIFDPSPADEPLHNLRLSNDHLLAAVRHLSQVYDAGAKRWRAVDYQHLDAEELGSIYESLLELIPRHSAVDLEFELVAAAGNARKTTGSYYTPSSLIELLLDSALDPVIDDAVKRGELRATAAGQPDPADSIADELLSLTVCDPACGSGHFLVAAARRIAKRVAAVREGNPEPTLPAVRAALHEVIARCIYGVDLNPMAVQLAKVSLWLEALEPGKALSFLDAHIKCGNALVGATPALLREGIPDAAFGPIEGDDKKWAKTIEKQNKTERAGQFDLFGLDMEVRVANTMFATDLRRITTAPADNLGQVRRQETAYRDLVTSPSYARAHHVADAWCAAFLWPKTKDAPQAPTHRVFLDLQHPDGDRSPSATHAAIASLSDQYRFLHWHLEFPDIFTVNGSAGAEAGWSGGFDCVVGNPPWERVKIQDKEFFGAKGRTDIVEATTASKRRKMIEALTDDEGQLYAEYLATIRESDGIAHLLRNSGRYPLTGQGGINTYSAFAETARTIVSPEGAAGVITPTSLATDNTTAPFFFDLLTTRRLLAFYDFENEAKIFQDVNNRPRFAITAMSGVRRLTDRTQFAFLTRHVEEIPDRRFTLAPDEVLAINPNTGTLPMFRTRTDAEIALGIYRRHPVLIRTSGLDRNPWGLSLGRQLHMAEDSHLFRQPADLTDAPFDGWSYHRDDTEYVPLYESKMLGHFDHRFSTYRDATQAQINKGTLPRPTGSQHDDPGMESLARYWVDRTEVRKQLAARWDRDWLLGWRDITNATNERTFIPSVLPVSAVGHVFPLAFPMKPDNGPLLQAVWSSMVFDYIARQKLSSTHLTYSVVNQLACPTPATFAMPAPWQPSVSLAEWVIPYVLELSYTSWRLRPYANEMGDDGPPFRWDPERRALLRADLDAAFLHIYGLTRPEAEHVLDSFFVVRKYEERDFGEFRTKRLVLDAYDRMSAAIEGTATWASLAPIAAGAGPRHQATA